MGIHMGSVPEAAILSCECFEQYLDSCSRARTKDKVKFLRESVEYMQHALSDILYSFRYLQR